MGRDSKNGGGPLIVCTWVRFNLSHRFHGSHLLAWRMGIEVESNHRVSRGTDEIRFIVFLSLRTIGSLRTICQNDAIRKDVNLGD
jgi:hypothetical protein